VAEEVIDAAPDRRNVADHRAGKGNVDHVDDRLTWLPEAAETSTT
jgi:hypothetical protein